MEWQEWSAADPLGGYVWSAREDQLANLPSAIFRTSPEDRDDPLIAGDSERDVSVEPVTDCYLAFKMQDTQDVENLGTTYVYHFGIGKLVPFDDAEVSTAKSSANYVVCSATGEFDSTEDWYCDVGGLWANLTGTQHDKAPPLRGTSM